MDWAEALVLTGLLGHRCSPRLASPGFDLNYGVSVVQLFFFFYLLVFFFGLYSEGGEECELCRDQEEGRAPHSLFRDWGSDPGMVTGALHGVHVSVRSAGRGDISALGRPLPAPGLLALGCPLVCPPFL